MALPINIVELVTGKTVESERIEFKKSWNPLDIIQTIAAFANDVNNWGGGYIVVGIEEKDGVPILPPHGIELNSVDAIQKEMLNLCHELRPQYFPITEPVAFQGKTVLIIWVPGGETRPYKAPDSLGKPRNYSYYIRRFSSTKKANDREVEELLRTSANVPFDDQIQQNSEITDLKLTLIQAHLANIGSELFKDSAVIPFTELCRKMNIAGGPDEYFKPKNIGLLLFNDNPKKFFPCAQIDLIQSKDNEGDNFTEKIFSGPIQQQLQDALLYLKNNILVEKIQKISGKAEATRVYNYPFDAIEEALANTVYHRSYQDDSPIEIRVFSSHLTIVSYPGPLPPLTKEKLLTGDIVARKYRNRRIGDFLKELHLTEGRGTGIPKIIKAMKKNGSDGPLFDTDNELSYFLVRLPIHKSFIQAGTQGSTQGSTQAGTQGNKESFGNIILKYCLRPKKRREIMSELGFSNNNHKTFIRYTKNLIDKGFLERTIPDIPNSMNQQYRTTYKGEKYLKGEDYLENDAQQKLNLDL